MKCNNCGFEFSDENQFCSNCGSPKTQLSQNVEDVSVVNPATEAITNILRDKLFLCICIFISISALTAIAAGGMNIFYILYSVFLWLAFFGAKNTTIDPKLLKNLSGTVFAFFLFNIILSGILFLCGIIVAAAVSLVGSDPDLLNKVLSYIGEFDQATIDTVKNILSFSGWIFLVVMLVACGLIVLIDLLSYKKIHNFTKSVYLSVQNGILDLKSVRATKVWLIIFAVSAGINVFSCSDILDVVNVACSVLAPVFAYCLVNKLDKSTKNEF